MQTHLKARSSLPARPLLLWLPTRPVYLLLCVGKFIHRVLHCLYKTRGAFVTGSPGPPHLPTLATAPLVVSWQVRLLKERRNERYAAADVLIFVQYNAGELLYLLVQVGGRWQGKRWAGWPHCGLCACLDGRQLIARSTRFARCLGALQCTDELCPRPPLRCRWTALSTLRRATSSQGSPWRSRSGGTRRSTPRPW